MDKNWISCLHKFSDLVGIAYKRVMMKWSKEIILDAMIMELADDTGIPMPEVLSRFELLFGKYVDYHALRTLIKNLESVENWNIIHRAKKLTLGGWL